MKYAQTEPLRYTIRSQNISDGAIPGLEINIQPTHTDSKILLIANIMSTGQHVSSFGFMRQIAGGGQTTLEPSGHLVTTVILAMVVLLLGIVVMIGRIRSMHIL